MGGEERKIGFQCPKCGIHRIIRASKLNKPNFTGLCISCWSHLNGGCRSREQREKIAQSLIKHTVVIGNEGHTKELKGLVSIHKSLRLWNGKANHCENDPTHVATRYHWANMTGVYTRDINDYASLCPRCHQHYDKNWAKIRGLFKRERMALNGIA